jgi:methylenetetrahydrofolate dehydrogenase (NADP+)/methenyltetrahydrofolate cyclohydrolase
MSKPADIETTLIDGSAIATSIRRRVAERAADFTVQHGRAPSLTTILVGDDPASAVYVSGKHKACAEVGIESVDERLPVDTSSEYLADLISDLGRDQSVDGILLQLPLPAALDDDAMTETIAPMKDVDGLTSVNAGRLIQNRHGLVPCTPRGVMLLLDEIGAELSGAEAVVVGRSNLVGRPVASLLLARNATVTTCHSRTADLTEHTRRADVIVSCVGRPGLITGAIVKPGAIVIDVGITRTDEGIVGDADLESLRGKASAVSPVPGGVGPMTIACLLENTLDAATARAEG